MKNIQIMVNGRLEEIPKAPGEMLSEVLREGLGLTGTKIGCSELECGSCTVLLDGDPVLSCVFPAAKADGASISTIEGLADGDLHPLQKSFVDYGAVQCGFCIPGQIMSAAGMLSRNPDPSVAEVRHALKDTLCRCAGYPTIERAVLAAAEALRTGEELQPFDIPITSDNAVIGQQVVRPARRVGARPGARPWCLRSSLPQRKHVTRRFPPSRSHYVPYP